LRNNLYGTTKGNHFDNNSLIETLKDGEEGFKQARKQSKIHISSLSLTSSRNSGQDRELSLQSQAMNLGETGTRREQQHGRRHASGLDRSESAVTSGDDHAIQECERGEDSAVKEYEDALKAICPPLMISA